MTDKTKIRKPATFSPPEDEIGERIKTRRKELDISVDELATLTALCDLEKGAGVSRATVYAYEANDSKPGARELRMLCEALNVSPNWLLLGHEWDEGTGEDVAIAHALRMLLDQIEFTSKMPDRDASRNLAHSARLDQVRAKRKR